MSFKHQNSASENQALQKTLHKSCNVWKIDNLKILTKWHCNGCKQHLTAWKDGRLHWIWRNRSVYGAYGAATGFFKKFLPLWEKRSSIYKMNYFTFTTRFWAWKRKKIITTSCELIVFFGNRKQIVNEQIVTNLNCLYVLN